MTPRTAPYGSWVSSIRAEDLVASSHPVSDGRFVDDEVWWTEQRPDQAGRYAVRRLGTDGRPVDVLPAPWNARTRVHEYGGGAWTVTGDGALIFAHFDDQRLYRLDARGSQPVPITPAPTGPATERYGELQMLRAGEVWCVRERHADDGTVIRDLAAVPVDGSAADDADAIRSVVAGSQFLAGARLSPDGRMLAWIAWNHPHMPWDGTELRVAELVDGRCGNWAVLTGSATESVLQPEWIDDDTLWVLSDRNGYWNLHRISVGAGPASLMSVAAVDADIGGPLWTLGAAWYRPLNDGRVLTVRTSGTDTVALLDPATSRYDDLDLGDSTSVSLGSVRGSTAVVTTGGARTPSGVRVLDVGTVALRDVRLAADDLPEPDYLPGAEIRTFQEQNGRDVHAVVYRPRNPDFQAPAGELPPFVAFVHGGPTAHAAPALSAATAFFTSRGIGVVDVNYGGSTGYGRAYRERLRGQWGIVDVQDTVSVVRGLAEAGIADGARLAIRGGSAGGWTVLSALTGTDVFACGVSLYGVAELIQFAAETHDFESRYLDGLIGPLPQARDLYDSRAPLNHVDELSCPVLLLQGLDDPIVPPSQAERFVAALVANGLPHAYRAYERESHGFRKRETIIDAYSSELSFYGQILGFETPGVEPIELWRP